MLIFRGVYFYHPLFDNPGVQIFRIDKAAKTPALNTIKQLHSGKQT